jgi:CHAT domain-containing protein
MRNETAALRDQLVTLCSRPRSEWDNDTIKRVEAELTALETEYAKLLTELKIQSPEVASLVSGEVASLTDIQNLLDSEVTLVEYYVLEDRTLAFIVTPSSFDLVTLEVGREQLAEAITAFRDFATVNNAHPRELQQLHQWLIGPLKSHLKTPSIGFVPHNVLHHLPFAAITDGQRYLNDDYVLFTLPNASMLRFIQTPRQAPPATILALGNPKIREPGLPNLSFAEQEVNSVANLFDTQALVGETATESAVWSSAGKVNVLHLAAHGTLNIQNPLFSTIHLTADDKNDGRLEVFEVYGLDLTGSTDLVVLSACESQLGELSAGDEFVGLNRAFLFTGTPSVIASLWNVDDKATSVLMERFYTQLRNGLGKAEALRQAQLEVRAEYPHPYYWAAFVLSGNGGPVQSTASNEKTPIETREGGSDNQNGPALPPPDEEKGLSGLSQSWPCSSGAAISLSLLLLVGCMDDTRRGRQNRPERKLYQRSSQVRGEKEWQKIGSFWVWDFVS